MNVEPDVQAAKFCMDGACQEATLPMWVRHRRIERKLDVRGNALACRASAGFDLMRVPGRRPCRELSAARLNHDAGDLLEEGDEPPDNSPGMDTCPILLAF